MQSNSFKWQSQETQLVWLLTPVTVLLCIASPWPLLLTPVSAEPHLLQKACLTSLVGLESLSLLPAISALFRKKLSPS